MPCACSPLYSLLSLLLAVQPTPPCAAAGRKSRERVRHGKYPTRTETVTSPTHTHMAHLIALATSSQHGPHHIEPRGRGGAVALREVFLHLAPVPVGVPGPLARAPPASSLKVQLKMRYTIEVTTHPTARPRVSSYCGRRRRTRAHSR